MSHYVKAAIAVAGLILAPSNVFAASTPKGIWMNDTGRGAIEIKQCGRRLCGHVVWVKSKKDKKGCGRKIIGNVAKVGKRTWGRGWIYSPQRGRRYDVELTPLKSGKLKVLGFAGSKFFSKTMYWTKAPTDLVLCGRTKTAAKANPAVKQVVKAKAEKKLHSETPSTQKSRSSDEKASAGVDKPKDAALPKDAVSAAPKETIENYASPDALEDDAEPIDELPPVASTGPKLGNLPIDKYLKKKGGRCKLDLPWVKVSFKCKNL